MLKEGDIIDSLTDIQESRYIVIINHGEYVTTYAVVDTYQPESEQPCVIHEWNTKREPNAKYLADDFCKRHNDKEPVDLTKVQERFKKVRSEHFNDMANEYDESDHVGEDFRKSGW